MLVVKPATISSGAVSPMTREIESMMPVVIPASDVGSTIRTIVSHLGTPSAYEASRSSFGTSLSISSLERTTTGIIRIDRATDPAKPDLTPSPRKITNSA